ncbi:hypothetical protein Gotur_025687 [Gossypium turneri]
MLTLVKQMKILTKMILI